MATAWAPSSIGGETPGRSARTSRTWRRMSWNVDGSVEQFGSAILLQLWIRAAASRNAIQPDIAIDLEPVGERLHGWATVVLPDGTGSGHPGGTADAWL